MWFEWWILGKQTLEQISALSGYSTRQLSRWFDEYLDSCPAWRIKFHGKVNLLIDGTWFPNKLCLVLYRNETVKSTLFYRLTDDEWEDEMVEDLRNIQSLGIEIESVTSDGGANIIKENISLHRGLSKKHYRNYVKWYIYFRERNNKKKRITPSRPNG